MGIFDEILGRVEETDRSVLSKYPFLKDTVEDMDTRLSKWETWGNAHIDPTTRRPKREVELESQLQAEQARTAALLAEKETEMTFDDIIAQAKPVIKQEADEAVKPIRTLLFDEKGNPKVATQDAVDNLSRGFQAFYARTANLPMKHFREFNEDLDMGEFIKYTGEKNLGADPDTAYSQFVAEKREAARKKAAEDLEAKHKEELEKVRKEADERVTRERAMAQHNPTDSSSAPSAAMGFRERMKLGKQDEGVDHKVPEGVELGDGRLSSLAYERYVKKQQQGADAA